MSKNKPKSRNQVEKENVPAPITSQQDGAFEFEKTMRFVREIVEMFAIAFVLAFLFRTFEGELFSIPTGSMAPTLMGRHKEYNCPECGFEYQVSASNEFDPNENAYTGHVVFGGTCPQCRYTAYLGEGNPHGKNFSSFNGDKILVNKYTLNFRRPNRWEVTVFRFPGDPRTSYIKRIVGLENETLAIHSGNIYIKKDGETEFQIARKSAPQLLATMQMVHCNDYMKAEHIAGGFPTRWHTDTRMTLHKSGDSDRRWDSDRRGPFGRRGNPEPQLASETIDIVHFDGMTEQTPDGWVTDDHISFRSKVTPAYTWLNYRHCIPTTEDWNQYKLGQFDPKTRPIPAQLITDFTAYNTFLSYKKPSQKHFVPTDHSANIFKRDVIRDGQHTTEYASLPNVRELGVNWVRDLAVQCELTTHQPQGEVVFELIGGGVPFHCALNIEKGTATLSIPGLPNFKQVTVATPVKGIGSWHVLFSNTDDQLRLFVDSQEIEFSDHNGTYSLSDDRSPTTRDLTPAAIGALNTEVSIDHLTVWRDIYYIAVDENTPIDDDRGSTNRDSLTNQISSNSEESLRQSFSDPTRWQYLGKTRVVERTLGPGQFFAMGDNTAHSDDSRTWLNRNPNASFYVPEKFLIGEALFVYWPHGKPVPGTDLKVVPNPGRMRFIH